MLEYEELCRDPAVFPCLAALKPAEFYALDGTADRRLVALMWLRILPSV